MRSRAVVGGLTVGAMLAATVVLVTPTILPRPVVSLSTLTPKDPRVAADSVDLVTNFPITCRIGAVCPTAVMVLTTVRTSTGVLLDSADIVYPASRTRDTLRVAKPICTMAPTATARSWAMALRDSASRVTAIGPVGASSAVTLRCRPVTAREIADADSFPPRSWRFVFCGDWMHKQSAFDLAALWAMRRVRAQTDTAQLAALRRDSLAVTAGPDSIRIATKHWADTATAIGSPLVVGYEVTFGFLRKNRYTGAVHMEHSPSLCAADSAAYAQSPAGRNP